MPVAYCLPGDANLFLVTAACMRLWMETPFVTAAAPSACRCPALPASH